MTELLPPPRGLFKVQELTLYRDVLTLRTYGTMKINGAECVPGTYRFEVGEVIQLEADSPVGAEVRRWIHPPQPLSGDFSPLPEIDESIDPEEERFAQWAAKMGLIDPRMSVPMDSPDFEEDDEEEDDDLDPYLDAPYLDDEDVYAEMEEPEIPLPADEILSENLTESDSVETQETPDEEPRRE